MNERVFVLLPVHNRRDVTRGLIECLHRQTYTNYRVLLIDDGSTDGTAEMVCEIIPETIVIRGTGNWWWAGGLQQGLNWLRVAGRVDPQDVILMINDDALVEPRFVEKALGILCSLDNCVLQPRILSMDGRQVLDDGIVFHEDTLTFEPWTGTGRINCLTTNGTFVRWKDLQKIGGFHPWVLPHYLSDYEFTIRASRRGLKMIVDPDLTLRWDPAKSGYRDFDGLTLIGFFRKLFSKKCPMNPIYRMTFAILVGKPRHLLRHVAAIWLDVVRMTVRHLKRNSLDEAT